uniref:NAD kinase 2, mitochondrial n=1 Tax=Hirondellea gigas TaxID=1518452 RepID=A0A6A7FUK4_9CRUS
MWLTGNRMLLTQLIKPFRVCMNSSAEWSSVPVFNPKKILILTKISRYEFERLMNQQLTEDELKQSLQSRGSDYNMLLHFHNLHKKVEASVSNAFEDAGITTRVVNRLDYTDETIDWADAVVTTGGDGTYLLAASRIQNNDKPVIGFNSDPNRSKGQLCLPEKYSFNVPEAVEKLLKGMFRWQFRSRIRITLIGDQVNEPPVELHDQQLLCPENRYLDIDQQLRKERPIKQYVASDDAEKELDIRVLPVLALNEVFIGECVSARVSYLELKFDGSEPIKQKCSGLIVSTGTGSTSWTYNVNKLTEQSMEQILNIALEETGQGTGGTDPKVVSRITEKFNELLLNDPEDNRLVYTIRDQLVSPPQSILARISGFNSKEIITGNISSDFDLDTRMAVSGGGGGLSMPYNRSASTNTFMSPNTLKPRGFSQTIHVRSRCFDAFLVIDGGMSFAFNDGTRAMLEIYPEDALRHVVLHESPVMVTYKH